MGGFREFLTKSNALALAIGVIIGAALGVVSTRSSTASSCRRSAGLLNGVDFASIKTVLGTNKATGEEVSIGWGLLINSLIVFVIVMLVVYLIAKIFVKDAATRGPDARGDAPDRDPRRAAQAQRLRRLATARSIEGPPATAGLAIQAGRIAGTSTRPRIVVCRAPSSDWS